MSPTPRHLVATAEDYALPWSTDKRTFKNNTQWRIKDTSGHQTDWTQLWTNGHLADLLWPCQANLCLWASQSLKPCAMGIVLSPARATALSANWRNKVTTANWEHSKAMSPTSQQWPTEHSKNNSESQNRVQTFKRMLLSQTRESHQIHTVTSQL